MGRTFVAVTATNEITIVVYGRPAPQGSKRGIAIRKGGVPTGRVAMVEQTSSTLKPWREAVKAAALEVRPQTPLDGPLFVGIAYFMPRPRSHYRAGRCADRGHHAMCSGRRLNETARPKPGSTLQMSPITACCRSGMSGSARRAAS